MHTVNALYQLLAFSAFLNKKLKGTLSVSIGSLHQYLCFCIYATNIHNNATSLLTSYYYYLFSKFDSWFINDIYEGLNK